MEYFHWPAWDLCLAVLPPSFCSSAEYEKLDEVLDFIATTENVSVINILLILNQKHSSYWE